MEVCDADAGDSTMSTAGLGCSLYMHAVWKEAYGTEIVRQYQGFYPQVPGRDGTQGS